MRYPFCVSFFMLTFAWASIADVIHVPADQPSIQEGIDAASHHDTVLVAPGTYMENINLRGKWIHVKSEEGPEATVIDGGNPSDPDLGSVVTCEHFEKPITILEGFTLYNGTGTCSNSTTYTYKGGGIYCRYSSPTFKNLIIKENCTNILGKYGYGGGLYHGDNAKPALEACTFIGNVANGYQGMGRGGAVHAEMNNPLELSDCVFIDNHAYGPGGAIYCKYTQVRVSRCSFINNSALHMGGAMYNWGLDLELEDCDFYGNHSDWRAGGVFGYATNMKVRRCQFRKNSGHNDGGGLTCRRGALKVYNSLFWRNTAEAGPGGGICAELCDTRIWGCTIVDNRALDQNKGWGGGVYISSYIYRNLEIDNCILWDNKAREGKEIWLGKEYGSSPITLWIDHTDLMGGQASVFVEPGAELGWGNGMIDEDPMFLDVERGDLHLTYGTPCMDAGDNRIGEHFDTDMEGDPRISEHWVDIGSDEFHTHLYCLGDAQPGAEVTAHLIGIPALDPIFLCFGSYILDPPLPTPFGNWCLGDPLVGPIALPVIPPSGVLELTAVVPLQWPTPMDLLMQALVRDSLSNLCILEIR